MNMISVFVGNENRTDLLRLNTQAVQSLDTFFQRKAEIDQQTGIAIVNECAITLCCRCPVKRFSLRSNTPGSASTDVRRIRLSVESGMLVSSMAIRTSTSSPASSSRT